MKVVLSVEAKNYDGRPLVEPSGAVIKLNEAIAHQLAIHEGGDQAILKYNLGMKLFNATEPVEISEAEEVLIREVANKMVAIVSAQIQIILNDAKALANSNAK